MLYLSAAKMSLRQETLDRVTVSITQDCLGFRTKKFRVPGVFRFQVHLDNLSFKDKLYLMKWAPTAPHTHTLDAQAP